jgi:YD repeat-containing protein
VTKLVDPLLQETRYSYDPAQRLASVADPRNNAVTSRRRPACSIVRWCVSGVYRRSVLLASGRFPMLDDGLGFRLVPWKPVIEPWLGKNLSAFVRMVCPGTSATTAALPSVDGLLRK